MVIDSNDEDPNYIPVANRPSLGETPRHKRRHRRRYDVPIYPFKVIETPIPEVTYEELLTLLVQEDDYYTNPFVSHKIMDPIVLGDEVDQLIQGTLYPETLQGITMFDLDEDTVTGTSSFLARRVNKAYLGVGPSLLKADVSAQTQGTYNGDPYTYFNKIAKFGRIYAENINVVQNTNWVGSVDIYEEGRLLGFHITCNDPDFVVTCMVENGAGTQEVINDMSYKDAVRHGHGMTYGEAVSTIPSGTIAVSRDVSGFISNLFPTVIRYKDVMTGSQIYADVKNTIDDRTYVMTFQPTVSIPYQRIVFKVFNGSILGDRLINRIEIKRMIYVDPDPEVITNIEKTDFEMLAETLQKLYSDATGQPQQTQSQQYYTPPTQLQAPQGQSEPQKANLAFTDDLYNDFMRYIHDRRNPRKMRINMNARNISDQSAEKRLLDYLNNDIVTPEAIPEFKKQDDKKIMRIRFE
jgi:hypothetical protein